MSACVDLRFFCSEGIVSLANKSKNSGSKPQGGESSLRKEIRGIVFLLLVIVLGVSLLSFHPA